MSRPGEPRGPPGAPAAAGPPGPRRAPVRGWPIAIALGVAAVILYAVRYALLPFLLAALIGFVLDPAIAWLQRRAGWPRWAVAAPLFLLLLAGAGLALWRIGAIVASDVAALLSEGPAALRQGLALLLGPDGRDLLGHHLTVDAAMQGLTGALGRLVGIPLVADVATIGLGSVLAFFLTLVLTAYMMVSGPDLAAGAVRLLPPERRGAVRAMLPRLVAVLRRYLLGVAGVVAFTAAAAWIGYGVVFHLPHAGLLSLAIGMLEIVPALGPFASMVLVALAAFRQHALWTVAGLGIYAVALRLVIDNLVGPLLLGQAARLHPVAIILAFVVGASLFGLVGLILAVPVAACARIVLAVYYAEPVRSRPGSPDQG